jgi:EAL domain-containing protein (putative c-di-GMP-specific phosphodiesterase class I)
MDTLLKNADIAMYRTKEMGRNGFQFFEPDMSVHATNRLELENALRRAIEREEFVIYYQPQMDMKTGGINSVEALIRWQHPTQGFLSPDKFLDIAEETGLIIPLGAWILKTACAQTRAWHGAGLACHRVSVNISAKQFWEGQLIKTVKRVLEETGLPPGDLELEITETVFLRDIKETIRTIEELRVMGISVSMDDFGTGYSSLTYLRHLPIEKLKIDGAFIHDLTTVSKSSVLLTQIIQLAHAMNLEVVAEGVETEKEYAFLVENNCDVAQGYYFNKPLSREDFGLLLKTPTSN